MNSGANFLGALAASHVFVTSPDAVDVEASTVILSSVLILRSTWQQLRVLYVFALRVLKLD